MDDLTGMLSQILSDPESMRQIRSVASSLGLTETGNSTPALPAPQPQAPPSPQEPAPQEGAAQSPDLSALSDLLSQFSSRNPQPASAGEPAGGPDLSQLSSLLGNLRNSSAIPQGQPGGGPDTSALSSLLGGLTGGANSGSPDLSALSGLVGSITGGQNQGDNGVAALAKLLGGGDSPQQQGGGMPFDMNTLLKLQKAMSSLGANRSNVDLLMALKPRLKEKRAKKIDDAVRVMQLIQFLPLIKESGLFGDLENGLGGLMGNLGSGLNSMLGGLLGGQGRR